MKNIRFKTDSLMVPHKAPVKEALITNRQPELDLNALRLANKDILEKEKSGLEYFFSANEPFADSYDQNIKRKLKKCWTNILKFESISTMLRKQVIQLVSNEIDKRIKDILSGLNDQSHNHYEQVVEFSNQVFKVDKVNNNQPFTIQTLLRIEIASIFFRISYQSAKDSKTPHLFFMNAGVISRYVNLKSFDLANYYKKFVLFRGSLIYDYEPMFKSLAILIYAIEINRKIGILANKQRQSKAQAQQETSIDIYQQIFAAYPQPFQFKLCEVCLLTKGYEPNNYSVSRKWMILNQIRYMKNLRGLDRQRMEFIRIMYRHSLTLQNIAYYYAGVTDISSQASKQLAHLFNLKQNLLKCQWIYMSDRKNIYEKLNRLTGCSFDHQGILSEFLVKKILSKVTKQRSKLVLFALRTIRSMFYSPAIRKQVFVCKFQYSFMKTKGFKPSKKYKDILCTLIAVANSSKILFYSIQRPDPQHQVDNLYKRTLVSLFTQFKPRLLQKGPFTVFLFNFWPLRFLNQSVYLQLRTFFNKQFKSFTYLSNIVGDFRLHFLLNIFVKRYLQAYSEKITTDNFYYYIQQAIHHYISKAGQNSSDVSKEQKLCRQS